MSGLYEGEVWGWRCLERWVGRVHTNLMTRHLYLLTVSHGSNVQLFLGWLYWKRGFLLVCYASYNLHLFYHIWTWGSSSLYARSQHSVTHHSPACYLDISGHGARLLLHVSQMSAREREKITKANSTARNFKVPARSLSDHRCIVSYPTITPHSRRIMHAFLRFIVDDPKLTSAALEYHKLHW